MAKLKSALLAAVIALGGFAARAEVFDNPDNHAYVGVRVGLDLMCPTQAEPDRADIDVYDKGPGVALGVMCYVPLWKNLYFEPGPQFYFNHIKYSVTKSDPDTGTNALECPISRFGLRIPFAFGYRFDFAPCAVTVFTGPVVDFCFSGHYNAKTIINSGNVSGKDRKGNFSRTSFAWKFGAGVIVKRFVVELSGTLGTLSSFKTSPNTFRNNSVALTIGYNFTK